VGIGAQLALERNKLAHDVLLRIVRKSGPGFTP
jgi:hypothetical protein